MGAPEFWSHQESAQTTVQQVKALKHWLDPFEQLLRGGS